MMRKKIGLLLVGAAACLLAMLFLQHRGMVLPDEIVVAAGEGEGMYHLQSAEASAEGAVTARLVQGTRVYQLAGSERFLLPVTPETYQSAVALTFGDRETWQQLAARYHLSEGIFAEGERYLAENAQRAVKITLYLADADVDNEGVSCRYSLLSVSQQQGLWQDVARGQDAERLRQNGGRYAGMGQALRSQFTQMAVYAFVQNDNQECLQAEKLSATIIGYLEEHGPKEAYCLRGRAEEQSVYFRLRSVYWQEQVKVEWSGGFSKTIVARAGLAGAELAQRALKQSAVYDRQQSGDYGPNRWLYALLLRSDG